MIFNGCKTFLIIDLSINSFHLLLHQEFSPFHFKGKFHNFFLTELNCQHQYFMPLVCLLNKTYELFILGMIAIHANLA